MSTGGGNNFDINAYLSQIGFGGSKNDGGGDGSGEAMTPDGVLKKGIDKAINTVVTKILGIGINPDIEGKSATAGFETQNVGQGLSPTNVSLLKDLQGGILAKIFKYFTRDIPQLFTGNEGGSASGDSGGGSSDSGGGTSGSGDMLASGGQGGNGDFPTFAAAADMPEMRSFGDKMIATGAADSVAMADLGNLRPDATPSGGRNMERDAGMAV